jgi:hypothetical protein
MGQIDELKYEAKLYELENGRWNYYVTVAFRMAQGWSQTLRVGDGSADSEGEALAAAQEKATVDRRERAEKQASQKTVALK